MSKIAGVVSAADTMRPDALIAYALRLEELGYDSLWLPDVFGREVYLTAGHILANTSRLRVATGIAHIYGRDAISTAQASRTLAELSGGRFINGLGVSNQIAAEMYGVAWGKPVRRMRSYLEAMAQAPLQIRKPASVAPVYVAAHGPKMLALAAELADGANTYLMPTEHTREARRILGADKRLNVVLPCCLCEDPVPARAVARKGLSIYLSLQVYQERWAAYGFGAEDYANGGSDRLIDTFIAWGDASAIRERAAAHIEAGADEIELLAYGADGGIAWDLLEQMAP